MAKILIDSEKCVFCGDCALICPVSVYNTQPPPCQIACPINTDVQGYLSLIAQGELTEAYEVVREVNPLPITCGRVCTRPCESKCNRAEIDEPIAICSLKRFVTDYEREHKKPASAKRTKDEKVAIIGAGPAGLAAAHDLAKLGYGVTAFEALPAAGGMLYWGIPEYRLPKTILQTEIDDIKALGIDIKTNTPIGEELTIEDLWKQGYQAILLAVGAQKGLKLGIPGEDEFEGTIDCVKFLRDVNLGKRDKPGDKVIVIGGGNAAIDSARSMLRLGAKEVSIIYRRARGEMPAIASEVDEAEHEGVRIHYLVAPSRVLGERGKVIGLECIHTKPGELDASGRRQPIPIEGSEFRMEADVIISAIGQQPDIAFLSGNSGVETSKENNLVVNPDTMATSRAGIFAAGDAAAVSATVIDAIASGKRAALSIDQYLKGVVFKEESLPRPVPRALEKDKIWGEIPKRSRQSPARLPLNERISSFKEVDFSFTKNSAVEEARRCLGCGVFSSTDVDSCCGLTCRICADSCWQSAIKVTD